MKTKQIITACDENQADILEWWVDNTQKMCPGIPITVFDIGLSKVSRAKLILKNVNVEELAPLENVHPWFNKPFALEQADGDMVLWLDIDCQIVKPIDEIWSMYDDDQMHDRMFLVPDVVMQRQGEAYDHEMNTGVILFHTGSKYINAVIKAWQREITKPLWGPHRGDQDALREIYVRDATINNIVYPWLDPKFNWLRLQYQRNEYNEDMRILHWTGPTGKNFLREKIIPDFYAERKPMDSVGHNWKPDNETD